jgi:hypothetical protein
MRLPALDKFDLQKPTTVKRGQLYVAGAVSALSLFSMATMAATSDRLPSLAAHAAAGDAVAAERTDSPPCVARDVKLVTAIEDAVADAYSTMAKARDLCTAGRVKDALAIYDRIRIAPVR